MNLLSKVKGNLFYFSFFIIYLMYFSSLEKHITTYMATNCRLDELIPFCKYFIIPYLLWFVYIIIALVYFFIFDIENFSKMAKFLTIGMTIYLVCCTFFHNGLDVNYRPILKNANDVFLILINKIRMLDPPTNVFPSIHVFNSIGVHIAIKRSSKVKPVFKNVSGCLCISICLATLFIKQHSIADVIGSLILDFVVYLFVYQREKRAKPVLTYQNRI